MEEGGYLDSRRTHQKMEMVPHEYCHIQLPGNVRRPVDLGKLEVSADPACWFNV